MQRALDALALAAPVRGEVQPWVWLLRAVADAHQLDSVHCCICYLVRLPAGPWRGTHERGSRVPRHVHHEHTDMLQRAVQKAGPQAD